MFSDHDAVPKITRKIKCQVAETSVGWGSFELRPYLSSLDAAKLRRLDTKINFPGTIKMKRKTFCIGYACVYDSPFPEDIRRNIRNWIFFELSINFYSGKSSCVCANGSRWTKCVLRITRNSFLSHEDPDSTYRVIYSKIKTFSVSYIIRHCVAPTMQHDCVPSDCKERPPERIPSGEVEITAQDTINL